MNRAKALRAEMALAALNCIPPSLRETLAYDARMRDNYGIRPDTVLQVGDSEFEAPVSAIVHGVKSALVGTPEVTLRDTEGNDWSIESDTDRKRPTLVFTQGERHVGMHGWLTLSPDRATRLLCLDCARHRSWPTADGLLLLEAGS